MTDDLQCSWCRGRGLPLQFLGLAAGPHGTVVRRYLCRSCGEMIDFTCEIGWQLRKAAKSLQK
jgi:hypothetical protein